MGHHFCDILEHRKKTKDISPEKYNYNCFFKATLIDKKKLEKKEKILDNKKDKRKEKKFERFWKEKIEKVKKQKIKRLLQDADVVIIKEDILQEDKQKIKQLLHLIFGIKKEFNFLLIMEGCENYEKNRDCLEMKFDGISPIDVFFPYLNQKDAMDYCESGTNDVLLEIMKKNCIALGINLRELIKNIKAKKFDYLSKTMQNIHFSRKKDVCLCVYSLAKNENEIRDGLDVYHFLLAIGASTQQAKDAFTYAMTKKKFNNEIMQHKLGDAFVYKKNEKIELIELMKSLRMIE